MLFQLHWQERLPPHRTEFMAQDSATTPEECEQVHERFMQIVERRKSECPEDWIPMVCDENAKEFVTAAAPAN